ncbi:MAG: GNAT family N-acetyltransferase [Lachnospiraceae bacterium]|nr:GNAT family N-acetyltransferase [Lachnospiraceae bacterium]
MITKVEKLTSAQLEHIRQIVGEAFVSNELFHNWGTEDERRDDVLKYMGLYADFVYQAGELYANEDMTGFIGLEDSGHKSVWPQIKMLLRMLVKIERSKIKSMLAFANQISGSNERYAKQRHFNALMVCVDKDQQGKGIASELVRFAKEKADMEGIPLLFDTDMKVYAEMYQHFGCELYNSITADNGVTRYSLCYRPG